jgi:hypothetical protein
LNNRATMPLATKIAMGNDIFEESVPLAGAQNIRSGNEHAGRCDPGARIRDKDGYSFAR